MSSLNGRNGFKMQMEDAAHYPPDLGYSVSVAGDVNGDGYSDLLIGASDSPSGYNVVLFGHSGIGCGSGERV
jgi:FG-GAP repeat